MFKTKLMTGIMLAAFALTPAIVMAGESSPSYANKKSGKVVFKSDDSVTEQTADTTAATAEAPSNVAEIEPAAGGETSSETAISETTKENSLAESMKLPRK